MDSDELQGLLMRLTASEKDTLGDHSELVSNQEIDDLVLMADKDLDNSIGFTP